MGIITIAIPRQLRDNVDHLLETASDFVRSRSEFIREAISSFFFRFLGEEEFRRYFLAHMKPVYFRNGRRYENPLSQENVIVSFKIDQNPLDLIDAIKDRYKLRSRSLVVGGALSWHYLRQKPIYLLSKSALVQDFLEIEGRDRDREGTNTGELYFDECIFLPELTPSTLANFHLELRDLEGSERTRFECQDEILYAKKNASLDCQLPPQQLLTTQDGETLELYR